MPSEGPNFSPYPFAVVRRLSRADAAIETAVARWIAARPLGGALAKLAGGAVTAQVIGAAPRTFDPHAAHAEVRIAGASITVAAAGRTVRALAQRLLGGPRELAAPRALTLAEDAIWVLAVAAAVEDARIVAEVWPCAGLPPGSTLDHGGAATIAAKPRAAMGASPRATTTHLALELAISIAGDAAPWTVVAYVPRSITVRVPPARPLPAWQLELPIVVARCAIEPEAVDRLAVRDVVTVERCLALQLAGGTVGLTAAPQAVEARVATGYVPASMSHALAETAQLELTVQLGTTRMTLRQLADLTPGAVVPLGRPLAGPFEVRAAGRLIGRGELVDVDGELGVRIVSLEE